MCYYEEKVVFTLKTDLKIKHIFEPNPLACGQAVISMLFGIDVYEVIAKAETDAELSKKQMISIIGDYGYKMSNIKGQAFSVKDLPNCAVLSLETPKCWHWSLFYNGVIYDPEYGVLNDFPISNRKYFFEIMF